MQRGSVLPVILIIICFIVLAVAGFIYFRNSGEKKLSQIAPASPPVVSTNSGIQTIKDSMLGLNLDIPSKHTLKRESEEEYFKRAYGDIRKNFSSYVLYPPAEFAEAFYIVSDTENNLDNAVLTVWVFKNPEDLDAKDFYSRYWYYPFVWGDFTQVKNEIAPANTELINGREVLSGVVGYRDGKPKFIYLPLMDRGLIIQIQFKSEDIVGSEIVQSFKFE